MTRTHPSIRWFIGAVALAACGGSATPGPANPDDTGAVHGTKAAQAPVDTSAEPATPAAEKSAPLDGKTIFRHDTFGDEMTWTDKLQMHTVVKAPPPPAGSFDAAAAERGKATFGKACAGCHTGGRGTDANDGKLHDPAEIGMDGTYASRAKTKKYRTTPLRALWQHPPYFHDGTAKTLAASRTSESSPELT